MSHFLTWTQNHVSVEEQLPHLIDAFFPKFADSDQSESKPKKKRSR